MALNPNKLTLLESVQTHYLSARDWLLAEVGETYTVGVRDSIDCNEPFLESPLEAIFLTWFHAVRAAHYYLCSDLDLRQQQSVEVRGQQYRLDFTVTPGDVDRWAEAEDLGVVWPKIGVELDGHDYHERTKEQVTRRNKRDRELTKAGWTIFHYSGSELHNKPQACADEVFQHAWRTSVDFNNRYVAVKRRQSK